MRKKWKFPLQISLVNLDKFVDHCDRVFFNKVAGQQFATLLKKGSVTGGADLCNIYKKASLKKNFIFLCDVWCYESKWVLRIYTGKYTHSKVSNFRKMK